MTARVRTYVDARLVLPGRIERGWLRTEGGLVTAVGPGAPGSGDQGERVPLDDNYLLPGLVDMHCHGGGGASMYSGDPDDVRRAARAHRDRGTTAMLGSVATVEPDAMLAAVRAVRDAVLDPDVPNLVGVHLEGPFLAASHRGAQTLAALRAPDTRIMDDLLDAASGVPVVMTIAPELDGATELIRDFAGRCLFAVGHTSATHAQVVAAVEAGARHVTHLFNAMPPLHHRDPGPVAAALSDSRLTFEIVGDGHHVLAPALDVAVRAGRDRTVLVTDAMAAAGLGDGRYTFADRTVDVVDGVARLAGTDRIAGSTAFLVDCVRNAVDASGADLVDAVRMASSTPARALSLRGRGALAAGARADLLVLDDTLQPVAVVVGGEDVECAADAARSEAVLGGRDRSR